MWYRRDASFWSNPDTRKAKRVHLMHADSVSRYGHPRALCGNVPLISDDDGGEFPDPPEAMKCMRCLRCAQMNGKNRVVRQRKADR